MVIEIPGINVEKGLELCDGDTDMYLRFLRRYVSSMPGTLDKIRTVSAETLRNYAIGIHGAKSISEYVGAEEASNTARKLEALANAGDLDGVLAQNSAFIKYAEDLTENARVWLEKNAPA